MRIAEAARRTQIPARLLRYYEDQGLLRPARNTSGYRDYSEDDLAAARRIRQLLDSGLSTAAIGVVMPCLVERAGQLAPTCPELVEQLRDEQARIDTRIDALTASRNAIGKVIAAADLKLPDGSLSSSVSKLTGLPPERIEELGGTGDWED